MNHFCYLAGSQIGFRNWVPKIDNFKILGRPIFQGRTQYSDNNHKLIEIRHNILVQCHEKYMRWKKFNYMLEIVIFRNNLEQEKNE